MRYIIFLFSPVVARWNVWAFIVLRVFQGMFEGVTFPALHAMIARWVPLEERNSFMSRSFMGSVFGLVITFPLCGYMRLLEIKMQCLHTDYLKLRQFEFLAAYISIVWPICMEAGGFLSGTGPPMHMPVVIQTI